MLKKLFYTLLLSILCAYVLITRQYFYDWDYYLDNSVFRIMILVMIPLLWIYMFIATVIYNVFIVYTPWSLSGISIHWRRIWYYVLAFAVVFFLHIGQLEILFNMRGYSIYSSGYVTGGMLWFIVLLLLYLFVLYRKPNFCVFNSFIWHLFKGGLLLGQRNFEKAKSIEQSLEVATAQQFAPMDKEEADTDGKKDRVMVYHVLLFYFSRKMGSFFMDNKGKKWFCTINANQLKDLESKDWFVRINKNTYLNMWYFKTDNLGKYSVLLDAQLADQWSEQDRDLLQQMLIISKRCRHYYRDHFDQRDQLPVTGWGQYIPFIL